MDPKLQLGQFHQHQLDRKDPRDQRVQQFLEDRKDPMDLLNL